MVLYLYSPLYAFMTWAGKTLPLLGTDATDVLSCSQIKPWIQNARYVGQLNWTQTKTCWCLKQTDGKIADCEGLLYLLIPFITNCEKRTLCQPADRIQRMRDMVWPNVILYFQPQGTSRVMFDLDFKMKQQLRSFLLPPEVQLQSEKEDKNKRTPIMQDVTVIISLFNVAIIRQSTSLCPKA
jgi:hypothetical protein